MKAPNLQTLPLQDPPGALTRSDVLPGNHPLRTKRSSERSELHNNVVQHCCAKRTSERSELHNTGVRIFSTRIRKFISY